ncbi:MAG: hypothetical protein HYZ69_01535 [Candidatus Colwellbacteria bacterium]|nr:hypothetical protein [Candidatus Colwellbacteria bacterium]
MENLVRTSTRFVTENARYVKINQKGIRDLALWIATSKLWTKELIHPTETRKILCINSSPRKKIEFLFIVDSINFCFWSKKERWNIAYNGKRYSGSIGSVYAIKKFFEENYEKANLKYFAKISYEEFCSIFLGEGELMLRKERWKCVRELCKTFLERYRGDVVKFVESAHQKTSALLNKIYLTLPYFADIHAYKGGFYGEQRRVWFLKRAQLLIADIWSAFGGEGIGHFQDIEYLTAFADYKIPQILHSKKYFGALEYAPELEEKIKNKVELGSGSKEEVEIRACAVQAVEHIVKEIRRMGQEVCPVTIDWILWYGSHQDFNIPHHRTKGIDY